MNFESPQFPIDKKDESSDTLSQKVKKTVALGSIAVAAMAGEACSQEQPAGTANNPPAAHEEKAVVHPEMQKGRIREQYELRKKQSGHEQKLILDNIKEAMNAGVLSKFDLSTNKFLQYYYQGLNGERNPAIFVEAQQMRVLEIAKKKGIELDLSNGTKMKINGGVVPYSAEVNGVSIPIADSDYTPRELEVVQWARGVKGSQDGKAMQQDPKARTNTIRTSPDFDKDADF